MINPVEEEKDSEQPLLETTVPEVKKEESPQKVTPVVVDEPRKQPETKQVPAEENKITIQPAQPTAEEIDADYAALIASGKERFHESERNQVDGRSRTPPDLL